MANPSGHQPYDGNSSSTGPPPPAYNPTCSTYQGNPQQQPPFQPAYGGGYNNTNPYGGGYNNNMPPPYNGYTVGNNGPYSGVSPPYPPTSPAYGGPLPPPPIGGYPYTPQQQQTPVYGKAAANPGSLELGNPSVSPIAEDKITEQLSIEIRHAFVRKVLGILALQILFTFGIASVFGFVPVLRNFLLRNYWLAIVGAVGGLILQLVLVCVPNLARKVPTNFILMTLITFCYAILISCAAAASSRDSFLIAIGSTFVVVVGLMLFACQTKYDFTGCGTYLFVAMLCVMIFGFLCIFFSSRIMHLVYSSIATVLFCMILVYDTQLVVGGKHRRYQYSVDDYIFAALTLYMDIIIIFMNILAIADNA